MINYFDSSINLDKVEEEVCRVFGNSKKKDKPKKSKKPKPFKPKVKEHWRRDATIKFKTLLETTENPKGSFTNKGKLVNVLINFPWGTSSSTSFDSNKKGKMELLKFLKKELYL